MSSMESVRPSSFLISDGLKEKARQIAFERRLTFAALVRLALEEFVARDAKAASRRPRPSGGATQAKKLVRSQGDHSLVG